MARIIGLYISPSHAERMQTRTAVRALAERGLEGDRYAVGQGTYSKAPRPVARHVSLIGSEAMDVANAQLRRCGLAPFEPEETRRNVVVEGMDVYLLLGRAFRIGAVRLRGSDITRPCHVPSAAAGKAGFKEAYQDRGGVLAEILSDGLVSIGDALVLEASSR